MIRKLNHYLFTLKLSTRSGNRTRTAIAGHRILSPACLPIPPSEQESMHKADAKVLKYFQIPIFVTIFYRPVPLPVRHRISSMHAFRRNRAYSMTDRICKALPYCGFRK